MITFRQAAAFDLDAVCGLYRMASQNAFSVWNEEYPTRIEAQHDLETNNLFVLEDDTLIIGAVSIVPEPEMDGFDVWQDKSGNHQEIARICLHRDYQGKGLARRLVSGILEVLKDRSASSVRLSAASCNIPACRTYGKIGFLLRGEADIFGGHYYLLEMLF